MNRIVLGYGQPKRGDDVVVLYAGADGDAAKKVLENPPAGIRLTELVVNPLRAKARGHDGSGVGYEGAAVSEKLTLAVRIEDLDEFKEWQAAAGECARVAAEKIEGLEKRIEEVTAERDALVDDVAKLRESFAVVEGGAGRPGNGLGQDAPATGEDAPATEGDAAADAPATGGEAPPVEVKGKGRKGLGGG